MNIDWHGRELIMTAFLESFIFFPSAEITEKFQDKRDLELWGLVRGLWVCLDFILKVD